MTGYVCIELSPVQNGYVHCKTWQELPSQPVLSSITQGQANQITTAVMSVVVLAFGWFILIRFLRKLL